MLNFKTFLSEEIENNASKGTLHEILVARHLRGGQMPDSFREGDQSPQNVHDKIQASISPDDYENADKRASEAAEKIKSHLREKHGIEPEHIDRVFWTSKKGEHKGVTHTDDPNNNADLMIKTNHPDEANRFHGISLKVGQKKSNLNNMGLKQLNGLFKADAGVIKFHTKKHKDFAETTPYHRAFKDHPDGKRLKKESWQLGMEYGEPEAQELDEHKKETLRNLASNYADAFNRLQHHEQHNAISSILVPETKTPITLAHTKTSREGRTTGHVVMNVQEQLNNLLKKHAEHGFVAVQQGSDIHIHGNNPDGTRKRIATINMKSDSPFHSFSSKVTSHL